MLLAVVLRTVTKERRGLPDGSNRQTCTRSYFVDVELVRSRQLADSIDISVDIECLLVVPNKFVPVEAFIDRAYLYEPLAYFSIEDISEQLLICFVTVGGNTLLHLGRAYERLLVGGRGASEHTLGYFLIAELVDKTDERLVGVCVAQ